MKGVVCRLRLGVREMLSERQAASGVGQTGVAVFWGRLQRTILLELFKVFGVALIALTGLILLAGVISEAMKSGLGPLQILSIIPLLTPSMLPYTVPAATLFATCIVYGRLSADNEILALKAAGVHVLHVMVPAIFLGIFASGATMLLYRDAIPYTHFLLKCEVASDVEESLYNMLRNDGCIRHRNLKYEIHVKNLQGRTLEDVFIKRRAARGFGFDLIAHAKEAELHVDSTTRELLLDMRQCEIVQGTANGVLDSRVWPIELPPELCDGESKLRATDMMWEELYESEEKTIEEKQALSREIDKHERTIALGRGAAHFAEHVSHLTNERKARDNQMLAIDTERHMRFALSLGCFCFALVGCPVGIWFCKSDYLSAFVICFLPIVTIYYPILLCMINMGRSGKIACWLSIHNANAMMLLVALILFRRLARN
jgi:lipopolysaccharide export system permease protein